MIKLKIQDKATVGSLKLARKKATNLHSMLQALETDEDLQNRMPKLRAVLAELTQRIHESSAYSNAYNNARKLEKDSESST